MTEWIPIVKALMDAGGLDILKQVTNNQNTEDSYKLEMISLLVSEMDDDGKVDVKDTIKKLIEKKTKIFDFIDKDAG